MCNILCCGVYFTNSVHGCWRIHHNIGVYTRLPLSVATLIKGQLLGGRLPRVYTPQYWAGVLQDSKGYNLTAHNITIDTVVSRALQTTVVFTLPSVEGREINPCLHTYNICWCNMKQECTDPSCPVTTPGGLIYKCNEAGSSAKVVKYLFAQGSIHNNGKVGVHLSLLEDSAEGKYINLFLGIEDIVRLRSFIDDKIKEALEIEDRVNRKKEV